MCQPQTTPASTARCVTPLPLVPNELNLPGAICHYSHSRMCLWYHWMYLLGGRPLQQPDVTPLPALCHWMCPLGGQQPFQDVTTQNAPFLMGALRRVLVVLHKPLPLTAGSITLLLDGPQATPTSYITSLPSIPVVPIESTRPQTTLPDT